MVAGVSFEDLLRDSVITHVGPEKVFVQVRRAWGSRALRILILWKEVGAIRHFIELNHLPQMPAEIPYVGNVQNGAPADFALNAEIGLVRGHGFGMRIDIAGKATGRE